MQLLVRKANRSDMPKVLELIKELATYEKEPDAVIINTNDLEEEGFGDNAIFTCFVAEINNEVVGMALVYPRFSTWKGRSLHLEDFVVSNSHRKKGIGEALFKEIMIYAKSQNLKRVQWEVLDWNTSAIDFYKKRGANFLTNWHLVQMNETGIKALAEH